MLEQELEKLSTEDLKRIIDEGELDEWNEGFLDGHQSTESDTIASGESVERSISTRHQQPAAEVAELVFAGPNKKKSDREEARDIIHFVQSQGFEGIAEEEWDSDELEELEELKKEIDRIQGELRFQRCACAALAFPFLG